MAIVPLAKMTLYGTAVEKDAILEGLQELGCLHLVDLKKRDDAPRPAASISTETHQAVKFLRACPTKRRPVRDEAEFQADEVVKEALRIEDRQQQLQQERDELLLAIGDLAPWGDFRGPADGELGEVRLWFYVIPNYRLRQLAERVLAWHVASRDRRFAYVVVLAEREPEGVPGRHVRMGGRSLAELRRRLEAVESEQENLHWQRVGLTRWRDLLSRTIALADDRAARRFAARRSWDDPAFFVVQGWGPEEETDRIRGFARDHGLGLTIEPPGEGDEPPTLLRNRGVAAGGQEAVTFYTTPAYRGWDPSGVVFFSFSLFFAMIMADAGYAMLLAVVLALVWRRMGRSSGGRRLRLLLFATVVMSVVYGTVVGSYFGLSPAEGSIFNRLQVVDAYDTGLMMKISIAVGVVHLAVANLALAWSRRWSPIMLSSLGWVAVLLGGLSFGFSDQADPMRAALRQYGARAVVGGLAAVLLFSSSRPWWTLNWRDHAARILDGLISLTGVTRAFGDVLSYLRLFALGLASAQLASTFNDLTYQASRNAGVGTLLAGLMAVLGHGLNFALGIMSGAVHGLRLNCIEFFGWSLPEEGSPFEPFCKKAK